MDDRQLHERMAAFGSDFLLDFSSVAQMWEMGDLDRDTCAGFLYKVLTEKTDPEFRKDVVEFMAQGGDIHSLWREAMEVRLQTGRLQALLDAPVHS